MRLRARSLRLKLASWFVLVFFVIQATLVAGVVFFRREMIRTSLDNTLSLSAEAMVDNILASGIDWNEEHVQPLVPKQAGFALYAIRDQAGEVLVSWGVRARAGLPFSAREHVPAGPLGGVHTRIGPERALELTGDAHELRLITLPFRQHDELYYFQAAVRDRAVDALLGPFFDLILIGVPVGLVAALVAAWIIAGRAVAPMRLLSRAAQDVSPTRIGERFEVPKDAEVARLAGELNSALERLEAGYRAQDHFIANVSHELKTPVAALLAQAQVAKMGERSLAKGYDFVDRAELLLKRLGKLVESFLVLARAGLTDLPRESVSVIDLVLGCLHSCKEIGEQNQVHLVPQLGVQDDGGLELALRGDAELLLTMVENLVHNAITHSPEGGEVTIVAERQGDSVRIAVRDRGPGIPEEYRERVFDRFVQVPGGSTQRGGSGLGLAIAKGIAVLHGGAIRVESPEGGGAAFVVTLPLAGPEAETPSS